MEQAEFNVNKNVDLGTYGEKYRYMLACSLIHYAGNNPDFNRALRQKVRIASAFRNPGIRPSIIEEAIYLYPAGRDQAERRAQWLFDNMGNERGTELLLAWASDPDTLPPKSLVVGIVGLAIPGISLGEIKRKRRLLNVFVNKHLTDDFAGLSQAVNHTTHGLFRQALKLAGGDIKKMEPDMADWLYEEGETHIYSSDEQELEKILGILGCNDIPHQKTGNKRIKAVSVSPALNQHMLSDWDIEKIG